MGVHCSASSQVPIIPIVMSSYQDFYSKKERRFTSGEFSRVDASGQGVAKKFMGDWGVSLRWGILRSCWTCQVDSARLSKRMVTVWEGR